MSAPRPSSGRSGPATSTGLNTSSGSTMDLRAPGCGTGRASLRSPLHVATDWPGYFPNGPHVVRVLVGAGADPNAAAGAPGHAETPLHWAASSDDLDVADALIDAGADMQALGGSIAGGTPLDNAVGYGCWHVARRLVERGARVEVLWHAAALGMLARVDELLAADPAPAAEDISNAFWHACHGGQLRAAALLQAACSTPSAGWGFCRSTRLRRSRSRSTSLWSRLGTYDTVELD